MISNKDICYIMDNPHFRDKKLTGLMGDPISENIKEIFEWIKNNCKGGAQFKGLMMLYTIEFDYDDDITLFSLKWL